MRTCTMTDCGKPHFARGWCVMHYARWQRSGDPAGVPKREKATCSVDDCSALAKTRGMCGKHAERVRRYGDPDASAFIRGDEVARFWSKVDKRGDDECWPWLGTLTGEGYSLFRAQGRRTSGHRFSYELHIGPIPDGLQVDHVYTRGCRLRSCVNPAHLEAVTCAENLARRVFA